VQGQRIAVVSPHVDDATLSLGAAIARTAQRGADVSVVTVLGNDPDSTAPAGPWDAGCGFRTVGEAARARQEEDRHACAVLGARPIWLAYGDEQYDRGADDGEIWDSILSAVNGADAVLVPGFPLEHQDHAWLARLVLARRPPEWRLGLYVEQPYALPAGPPHLLEESVGFVPRLGDWSSIRVTWRERRKKLRACREYRSQLEMIGRSYGITWRDIERRIRKHEARRGGEVVAWLPPKR
jgi:LmbE family N-acetylglucosaminyl deacetylase